MRKVIPALVIIGLALGAWLLWPRDAGVPTTTLPEAGATSTTTSTQVTSTAPTGISTTSTDADSHVVETVAEAEEILRQLWFGWFEGIYNEDVDRIREVVVLEETVATATQSFGSDFAREPEPSDISFAETQIVRSDQECLAIWSELILTGFSSGRSLGLEVLRWTDHGWKSLSVWTSRSDLWEADCESSLP
jgi:hypothetical protein